MARITLILLLLGSLLSVALSYGGAADGRLPDPRQWTGWKATYGKGFGTLEEDLDRQLTWLMNQELIEKHNREYDQGRRTFRMAMNAFGDQDPASIRRPRVFNAANRPLPGMAFNKSSASTRPSSWDWRKQGAVNPVQNQGMVDTALPINIADAVASFSTIHNKTKLYELSRQEVVDCCLPDPLLEATVFDCIKADGGLCANGTYHIGNASNPCNNGSCKAVASPQHGGKTVKSGDEDALADAVTLTPIVVGVDASRPSFQFYVSGVYLDPSCSSTQLDHSMLVVGYGADSSGIEYWICQNTWGMSWGMDGYMYIARNKDNMCGIATTPIYPY